MAVAFVVAGLAGCSKSATSNTTGAASAAPSRTASSASTTSSVSTATTPGLTSETGAGGVASEHAAAAVVQGFLQAAGEHNRDAANAFLDPAQADAFWKIVEPDRKRLDVVHTYQLMCFRMADQKPTTCDITKGGVSIGWGFTVGKGPTPAFVITKIDQFDIGPR